MSRARDYSHHTFAIPGHIQVGNGAAVEGMPAKHGNDDFIFTPCGADDEAYEGPFAHDAADDKKRGVSVFGVTGSLVKHKIGTGGCTRGSYGVVVANGYADAPAHDSDGPNNSVIVCKFWQSGLEGDMRLAEVIKFTRGTA